MIFFGFSLPQSTGYRNLVPWAGMEPAPPAVETLNLTQWTAREVPLKMWFISCLTGKKELCGHQCGLSVPSIMNIKNSFQIDITFFTRPGGQVFPGCFMQYICSLLRHTGFSCCRAQALEHMGSVTCGLWAYLLYHMWDLSSPTRNRTWVSCITR